MIAELPDGGRADAILVDVGPGSFTGIRVGIAAARGLALGWGVPVSGYSSLPLIAAAAFAADPALDRLAVVLEGGHGEVFMQPFAADPFAATADSRRWRPPTALARLDGAPRDRQRRPLPAALDAGSTTALPRCRRCDRCFPPPSPPCPPRPIYGRAPDAKPMARARPHEHRSRSTCARATSATSTEVDRLMADAFDPRLGEAWTRNQVIGILSVPGVWLTIAELDGRAVGFALARGVLDEAELLLLAVMPRRAAQRRRRGVAARRSSPMRDARQSRQLHLEVRDGNDAIKLYRSAGFSKVGERRDYYRGTDGQSYSALTLRRKLA